MAKTNSIVMHGMQGTLGDLTFVNSKTYKPHVRTKRGTKKKAVLNSAFKLSGKHVKKTNRAAQLIFNALRDEHHDGKLWPQLLSIFRKEWKEGKMPDANAFANVECSLKHKLEDLLYSSFVSVSTKSTPKTLEVTITLSRHPRWKPKGVNRYIPSLIAIFPDYSKNKMRKEVIEHPVVFLESPLTPFVFEIPKTAKAKAPVLFFGILGCCDDRKPDAGLVNLAGMKGLECKM